MWALLRPQKFGLGAQTPFLSTNQVLLTPLGISHPLDRFLYSVISSDGISIDTTRPFCLAKENGPF